MLVHHFGEGLSCPQAAKDYCIIFMHQSQAMQEADQLLSHLTQRKKEQNVSGQGSTVAETEEVCKAEKGQGEWNSILRC